MSKVADLERRVVEAEQKAETARVFCNTALGHVLALRVALILQSAGLRADDPAAAGVIDRLMVVPEGQDGGMRRDVLGTLKLLAGEVSDFQAAQSKH